MAKNLLKSGEDKTNTMVWMLIGMFLPPWALMFAVAVLGWHFGYWKCVILDNGFGIPLTWAVMDGVRSALSRMKAL